MKNFLLPFAFFFLVGPLFSQQITYSQPQTNDLVRTLNFEIIGKMDGNFLVYKNIRDKHSISVYNKDMQLTESTDLQFMDDRVLNVDFVLYSDFAWLIYQYQKKNVLHCSAVKINKDGKLLTNPMDIDTTMINYSADNKIYTTISSEDKSKIMIFKIQKVKDLYNFTTLLFNDSLQLLHKSQIATTYESRKNIFSAFLLSNEGNFVFTRGDRPNSRNYIEQLTLMTKAPDSDSFDLTPINLSEKYVDEIKLKVDNVNHHYLVNTFYYDKKRGDVAGIFMAAFKEGTNTQTSGSFLSFGDNIRSEAKSDGNSTKSGLNDYLIKDIVLKKDGGFILIAEDFYSQSKSNPWDRYDYLYGSPYFSPYYFNNYSYSPFGYGSMYGNRFYDYRGSQVRYFYNNLLVLSVNNAGNLDWGSVIHKSQYDDDKDNFLSYAQVLTGGQIHFLFNELERRKQLINDQSISSTGEVTRNPPLRSLDKGYEFMPRYAKQVSATEVIIPCIYRNYICFAKVEY
jgi:hypothetical protein